MPPGCTALYSCAVESDSLGRLKALAVFAFCAEITRLPGHCDPRSAPVNATAHTTPSRLTTVAHISRLNPPLDWLRAAVRAAFSWLQFGRSLHASLSLVMGESSWWRTEKQESKAEGDRRLSGDRPKLARSESENQS